MEAVEAKVIDFDIHGFEFTAQIHLPWINMLVVMHDSNKRVIECSNSTRILISEYCLALMKAKFLATHEGTINVIVFQNICEGRIESNDDG